MRCILLFLLSIISLFVCADNLRIDREVRIVAVSSDFAELEVKLSWSNSWRNSYNYDAVYLFGKYRTADVPEWYHLFFDATPEAHVVGMDYQVAPGNGGRGLFLFRTGDGQGTSEVTLRLKWNFTENKAFPLTAAVLNAGNVLLSIQGLEMVYLPTASFYAGDGISANCFSDSDFGILPAEDDVIGTNSNFIYTGSTTALANAPADRIDDGYWDAADRHDWSGVGKESWWRVDFKTPKRILYFGVSGFPDTSPNPAIPASEWYFEGSLNATVWDTLWSGGPEYWSQSFHTYPIQRAIKVSRPGDYRYYRVRVKDNCREAYWNNVYIANVGMTERDLGEKNSQPFLLNGFRSSLPADCPVGCAGFYAMKYEVTQEQYVVFLNQQNRSAQYRRTIGGLLDGLKEGEYVFGDDRKRFSHRNGIILQERKRDAGEPYVFSCNLDKTDIANSIHDGHTLACNYLTPMDMLAYADWSGLRPLNELEYERMSRAAYPHYPLGGELASGEVSADYGSGFSGEGTSDEAFALGQVNAGGVKDGPIRVGSFVRTGKSHGQMGTSFWGISDLSGNLAEIYYNTGIYGRQLKGGEHGDGQLDNFGNTDVRVDAWPRELSAFGVRGGSYASDIAGLAVSDRSQATDCFTSLTERKPTVGFRLGFSIPQTHFTTILTLENGLESGNQLVYDTVCSGSEYIIRSNLSSDVAYPRYTWYCSKDRGNNWTLIEGATKADLYLSKWMLEFERDTTVEYRYKCCVLSLSGRSESGGIGLWVGAGYRVNKLSDSLRPCVLSEGFVVHTTLPTRFEWMCLDNGERLRAATETPVSSHYRVATEDFQKDGERLSGRYTVLLKMTVAGRCETLQRFSVLSIPHTISPFLTLSDTIVYSKDTHKVMEYWGGPDAQAWTIVNEEKGMLSIDSLGTMSGLSKTIVNRVTVEAVCSDFPDKKYRKVLHELQREIVYSGNVQEVRFLPGSYSFECWGAQGGTMQAGYTGIGGKGGYAKGELVTMNTVALYLYIGGQGQGYNGSTNHYGGWNGGGTCYAGASGGGGATDVRVANGGWNDAASLRGRIMVAGGGGGSNDYQNGGNAGGLSGGTGACSSGSPGTGGTQTAGGGGWLGGSFGVGAGAVNSYGDGGAGGGGYYGGGKANGSGCAGGGGSGFVSGMNGCNAVNASGVHTGQPNHYSGIIFRNAAMSSGARSGHGMIRISVQ